MSNPVTEFLNFEKHGADPRWAEFAGQAAITAGLIGAGHVADDVYGLIRNAIGKSRGFKGMMEYNPELAKEDRVKVQTLYNTLHHVSPSLARDPVVANSWVKRMMYQDEYVDPKILSDLATAEQRMGQASGYEARFSGMMQEGVKSTIGGGTLPWSPSKGRP